jgi:hypothetical protein
MSYYSGRLTDKTKGLGEVLAGTSYEYAVVTFSGPLGLVPGPSLKVDNL